MRSIFQATGLAAMAILAVAAQSGDQTDPEKLRSDLDRAQTEWEQSPEAHAAPVDWTITRDLVVQRRLAGASRFDGNRIIDVDMEHEEAVHFGNHDRFSISAWILSNQPSGAIVVRGKDVPNSAGYSFCLADSKLQVNFIHHWPDDALSVETEQGIEQNGWHNVTMAYDGSSVASSIRMYVDGRAEKTKVKIDKLHESFETTEPLWIAGGNGPESRFRGQMRLVRIYRTVLTPDEVEVIATTTPVSTIAQTPRAKRTHGESEKIRRYFLERAAPKEMRGVWQRTVE